MGKTLIILTSLVVLAGAVLAYAAVRPAGSVSAWQPRIAHMFGGLITRPLSPLDLNVQSGSCRIDETVLTVPPGTQCLLRVAASDQRLRRGALRVGRGPVRIGATQSAYGGPAKILAAGERYDLNIEREGETVSINCRNLEACRLTLEASR